MNQLVDIGVNVMHRQFNEDREQVIKQAVDAGVKQMILTGTSIHSSEQGSRFALSKPGVLYATAGIHPHEAKTYNASNHEKLKALLNKSHVVAVGECGLDFNRNFSTPQEQETCFEGQLRLARETGKPLFLHERDAHHRFVEMMKNYDDLIAKSVVHCFTGSETEVKEYLEMGFFIGITGWVCDERRGGNLRKAVKSIPLDRILIETDAPFLSPKPKVRRNEPAFLVTVATTLASSMGVSVEELIQCSTQNAKQLFGI